MSTIPGPLYQTTKEILSESDFNAVLWFGVGLCTVASAIRYGIRVLSYQRLLPEDYLMLFALLILIAISGILQRYVGDMYDLTYLLNGLTFPGPDFEQRILHALRASGIVLTIGSVGIYTIKLNFLAFLYRLGHHIKAYLIFWWVATVFTVVSLIVNLGVIPHKCLFGDILYATVECATESSVGHIYLVYKVIVALDVICDALIIAFLVIVTWRTKMTMRQKAVISAVFLLVVFTIGVTIVRASIFGGVYNEQVVANRKVIDTAWVLFWLYVEILVSFIINCIISFRSLWVSRKGKAKDDVAEREKQKRILMYQQQANNKDRSRWQVFRQGVLDTFAHLEGTSQHERESSDFIQVEPPSGSITVDFSNWGRTQDPEAGGNVTK
ncbi:hypothetical protein F4777DRAFT_592266 [Nemania sp. FL0916]|nr:hypothetical protein F4777DRAFT_592266 [Nemania sp. FL0916]